MRTCISTLLLLLLTSVGGAAVPTTQPIAAATDPVRENGIEFQAVVQARWPIPAAGEKTEIQLGLKVTNRTEKVVQINLFDTVQIVLKDATGRSLPIQGGRDRTTYPDPRILAPAEAGTIARNASLEWLKNGDGLRIIGRDGTGGIWYIDGLKAGKYALSFEYENTEQMVRDLPNRPAPHAIDLKAGPYWYGKVKTKEAEVEIVEPDSIDHLVARLSANPLWQNGRSPAIDLPEHASAEQVVAKVFEMISFDKGKVTKHRIVKVRRVEIQRSPYTAALVETELGEKVVLFGFVGGRLGWWSRVFDAESPAKTPAGPATQPLQQDLQPQ